MTAYISRCEVCLALKTINHKSYFSFQSLPDQVHIRKNLWMSFVTRLAHSIGWKKNCYNTIVFIIEELPLIVSYEPIKTKINIAGCVGIIIDVRVRYNNPPKTIANNESSVFTSKFSSLLCYFLDIKQKLSITFNQKIKAQIDKENSTIKAYLQAYIDFK